VSLPPSLPASASLNLFLLLLPSRVVLTKFIARMQSGVDVIKISNSPITRHITRTLFLDRAAQRLCWSPPGRSVPFIELSLTVPLSTSLAPPFLFPFRAQLLPEEGRFIPIFAIQNIRIGAGKFENCLSIVTEKKTLLIKIDETKLLSEVTEGLLLICDLNKDKQKRASTRR
jgi:hypothetical protein